MTSPAPLTTPDARLSIEQRAVQAGDALNAAHRAGLDLQKEPVKALYPVYLAWRATDPRKATTRQGLKFGGYTSAFAAVLGVDLSNLYLWLPAAQAWHELGHNAHRPEAYTILQTGTIEDWAVIGRALDQGWTYDRLELVLSQGGLAALSAALSGAEGSAEDQAIRAIARERAALLNPDLPRTARAQDTQNAALVNVLPEGIVAVGYAALRGDQNAVALVDGLKAAARPVSYYSFLKLRGRCFICDLLAGEGEILDLHHVGIGEKEARPNDDTPTVMVGAHRECHIPQPFDPRPVAHSRAYTVGNDPEQLVRLLTYNAHHLAAYQQAIGADA